MENLILLLLCFIGGIVLRFSGRLPENAPAALNGFVIHISLPALILLYVHDIELDSSIIYPIAAPWLLFVLGVAFFGSVGRLAGWSPPTIGGLILAGSLANTSFVGLPMIEAFYGVGFLGLGILIDQLGTYLALSTLGILVAVLHSPEVVTKFSAALVVRKVLTFAPFQALVLAFALQRVEFSPAVETILGRLGGTLAPLALVSVGYQLRLSDIKGRAEPLALGLLFKLVVGPLLIALLLVPVIGLDDPATQVTIFEVAMASQIGGAIVAIENKLNPPLVTLMVGIGIPLSFLTLPLWWLVLKGT